MTNDIGRNQKSLTQKDSGVTQAGLYLHETAFKFTYQLWKNTLLLQRSYMLFIDYYILAQYIGMCCQQFRLSNCRRRRGWSLNQSWLSKYFRLASCGHLITSKSNFAFSAQFHVKLPISISAASCIHLSLKERLTNPVNGLVVGWKKGCGRIGQIKVR